WWSFLASAIATAVIYSAVSRFGLVYVLLSVPLIAATYWTYKIYFERVNAKTREAEELSRLHLATVEALATAIDAKDQTTHCHVRRVQIYADGLGKLLRLSEAELAAMKAGALLHDIGKLAVPDQILNKPGMLTPAEFEKTKIHTIVGEEILKRVNFPYPVLPIVRHHHERWDGAIGFDSVLECMLSANPRASTSASNFGRCLMNNSTIRGSKWVPEPFLKSAMASSLDMPSRKGRSSRTESKQSITDMIRAVIGISSWLKPSG